MAQVQITGGPFEDASGAPLANGYLVFQLQHDAAILNFAQIMGNMAVHIPLDNNGYIQGTVSGTPIYMWPNDLMTPLGTNYIVWAYDANNRLAWDNPQVQQILQSPNPYNINAWTPGP